MAIKYKHIGQTIKKLRLLSGLNQVQLADMIGKTRGMVSHIEVSGKVNYYTLKQIAEALGTSAQYIESYHENDDGISGMTVKNTPVHTPNQEALQNENKLLKEIIAYQRKLIAVLEANAINK